MCLVIDRKFHPELVAERHAPTFSYSYATSISSPFWCVRTYPAPRYAERDLLVYKVLSNNLPFKKMGTGWVTPIVKMPIDFSNEGKATCVAILDAQANRDDDGYSVVRGIHSFASGTEETELMRAFKESCCTKVFEAVIPAYTRFYIGENDDVVSEKLIIYNGAAPRNIMKLKTYKKKLNV